MSVDVSGEQDAGSSSIVDRYLPPVVLPQRQLVNLTLGNLACPSTGQCQRPINIPVDVNGVNYPVKNFIKVANKATVEQQKSRSNQETNYTEPGDYWVAYIIEIRASDKHHVYILVYWMYWPDELPLGARIGRKVVQGRQPYHGANELIASNCMEVINAASVTGPVIVKQLIESNNEEVQRALYWRQAYNWCTSKLWPVRRWCKCQSHANPDEIFIGCTNTGCMEWMHLKCMVHDILMKVYEQRVIVGQRPEGVTHPLSTIDTKAREVQHLIDIRPKETQADDHTQLDVRERVSKTETSTPMLTSFKYKTLKIVYEPKKEGRKKKAAGLKPYEGLFEADLKSQCSPPVWEIRDLRTNGGANDGKSTEAVHCLQCGVLVM
ncbi:uncharacterized protein FMAN_16255 [Fusarium mangiferae]|uniref:BAH domain-containing protein n=1 Tax=Fusarium mangiferae TaxID=192010 RepID=A0A1L7UBQ7_FUSMA|nr:uncharacterized protein FMAN_16255 [Fusarium mangiferae]CVL08164.1 uncharacterized protein FMAN_16255 [Fusarium mangiferae]